MSTGFVGGRPLGTPFLPDGQPEASPLIIGPLGGGVIVTGGGGETVISSQTPVLNLGKLTELKMTCLVAPGADVVALLKNFAAGPTALSIDLFTTYTIGRHLDFSFKGAPLQSSAVLGPFVIDIPAGGGTWRVYAIGYQLNRSAVV